MPAGEGIKGNEISKQHCKRCKLQQHNWNAQDNFAEPELDMITAARKMRKIKKGKRS